MKATILFFSLLFIFFAAQADFGEINPIEEAPICQGNENSTQVIVTQEHLRAIEQAVQCGDLQRAVQISQGLNKYLRQEVAATPRGSCYDDRKCTSLLVNNQTTIDMCKAAGGKSWSQAGGACVLVK